jgi:hypothetical protein
MRKHSQKFFLAFVLGCSAICAGCRQPLRSDHLPSGGPDLRLIGTVRDSATPVRDASVALFRGRTLLRRVTTDKDGRFAISQQQGIYTLSVTSPNFLPCRMDVSIFPGYETVLIGMRRESSSSTVGSERPNQNSTCGCRFPVSKSASTANSSARAPLQAPGMSTGTLAVDVSDPEDGSGVPRAEVILFTESSSNSRRSTLTDQTGRAIFVDIPSAKYRVLVRRVGFVANETTTFVRPGVIDSLSLPFKWNTGQGCIIIDHGF